MDSKSKTPKYCIKVPDVEWETTGRYVRPPASNENPAYQFLACNELLNKVVQESCVNLCSISYTGDNNGLCKLRFYYHMQGAGIGSLRVLVADRYLQRTVWTKSSSQSVNWARAEIPLVNMSTSFYVSFLNKPIDGYYNSPQILGDNCFKMFHELEQFF